MMKKLFIFLLKKYSNTESQRVEIYKRLWYKTCQEYSEQTAFGNVYNMNIEVLMSNPFFVRMCNDRNTEYLKMLKSGLSDSFDKSIEFTIEG